MSDFNTAINIVLKHEGGYVNNPNDPGGETKYGISKAQYPNVDIKNLSLDAAKRIYYEDYWLGRGVNGIFSQEVANFALDTVVHHGKGPQILQEAAIISGKRIALDNSMGPQTRNAINSIDPNTYLKNAVNARVEYIHSVVANNPNLKYAEKGMIKRAKSFFLSPMKMTLGIAGLLALAGGLYIWMRQR